MRDSKSPSPPSPGLAPRLLRSLRKTQPVQQVTQSGPRTEHTSRSTPIRYMSKQKATAIEHFARLTHRSRTQAQVETAVHDADPVEYSSQTLPTVQTPIDTRKNDEHHDVAVTDNPGQISPEPVVSSTFAKRMQDMLFTLPYLPSSIGSSSSQPTPPAPQTETDDTSPARGPHHLFSLTLPGFENGLLEHAWRSFWSALDRLRLPYNKPAGGPEPARDEILDCIDDNNSVMMYGPLEPDDTSEVEIACSEIISINGDGEEIRTPQPRFIPLPSESVDEALVGRGPRSPPPRFVSLPLESVDEALVGRGLRSPSPRFTPLPLNSIDQVLIGGGRDVSSPRWKEDELEISPETTGAAQVAPTAEGMVNKPPVKEYRVWLPSPTKISVQTMWWGFRIYLPPPVLDVLNNKQLEAAKRAAIITTALQWLMDHLPLSLLPPQMHPGVAILRYLVPYVGYIGGFIAWSWSAIRSFDKGYGVVLTATWLLPFALIPGTWEADEVPDLSADLQPSTTVPS